MKFRGILAALVLLFIPTLFLAAHPHMWIRGTLKPVLGPRGLIAVDVGWKFDEYSNARFIADYDKNLDGDIDESESETIRVESFSRLYDSEYYLVVDVGGLRGTPLEAEDFRATINDGQIFYSFRVPLEITVRWNDMDKLGIYLFDPSYFIDFRNDGMETVTAQWEDRTLEFFLARRELETQGYGKVSVIGLQAGYDVRGTTARTSLSAWIKDKSYLLQERLGSYTRRVIINRDMRAFWAAMGFSILFGLLHVMGPGHGKVFTLAYFSSRQAGLGEGLLLSALINILDSISAFLLVGITYGVLFLTIQESAVIAGRITRIVAYGAIALIGFGHVIVHFFHSKHREPEDNLKPDSRRLKPWMLAIFVGLVPCPVSSSLLAYGMAEGHIGFSMLLVAGVSIGGMTALSLYSFLIISGKSGLVKMANHRGSTRLLEWFEQLSMALLGVFGIVMLIGIL